MLKNQKLFKHHASISYFWVRDTHPVLYPGHRYQDHKEQKTATEEIINNKNQVIAQFPFLLY